MEQPCAKGCIVILATICTLQQLLYFTWKDQSKVAHCIMHKVLIYHITVVHESYSIVMQQIK